ncbi:ParB/RepB/Spo0J family partition protein [Inquilinus sp. CA228]|uniref:ParB/RepB/Spo0J family partition protein n=1 Tax=Inquilinus sp. CA228 TaxID=3455609 RepID=UPI003F8D50A1
MTTIIRDIPLSKLVPSAQNVRRTGRENGIEELAASIAAHGLLQSLSVRAVLDGEGAETGKYEVIGGGRRLAALKLLAKRKQISKSAPIPCLIADGEGEELSLAENLVRENLHPADQFGAFKRLADEHGLGRHCHGNFDGVSGVAVGQGHGANFLRPSPVPARDHSACGMALSAVHFELPRCRGVAGRTRARRLL